MLKLNRKSLAIGAIILLSLVIILVLFMLPRTKPVRLTASCAARHSVLLVPLDSRPVCSSLPQKLGQLAGLNVILPPKAYLDNYKTPADKEKLRQWLRCSSHFYKHSTGQQRILPDSYRGGSKLTVEANF